MLLPTLTISLSVFAPSHPSGLVFPEYVFNTPSAEEYTETLQNGITVFIVENKELPLIQVDATFRGGNYLDAVDQVGVTEMMSSLVRSGGTTSVTAEELDERFAFLAANAGVFGGNSVTTASLDSLASNFEESFELFLDMLQNPKFQESKLRVLKENAIEGMKQRNDHPSSILSREFSSKLFGDSHLGREPVGDSILSIDRDALLKIHAEIISPENLTISISGDFDKGQMMELLNASLGTWEAGASVSDPPNIDSTFEPGVYYVDQDVSQGGVRIGLRTVFQDDPDVEAMRVMNYILGGGGFNSRITQSVRSNEGLAYGASSSFSAGPWARGVWRAGFESKSTTVALAAKLIFDEIERIKTELVSAEDLALAKSAIIERFPSKFRSKSGTLGVFVTDRITGRDPGYWNTYRDKIRSVTAEDVVRVANRILIPEEMVVVVVGDWDTIKSGDIDGRATMEDIHLIVGGEVVELPLLDPLSLRVSSE